MSRISGPLCSLQLGSASKVEGALLRVSRWQWGTGRLPKGLENQHHGLGALGSPPAQPGLVSFTTVRRNNVQKAPFYLYQTPCKGQVAPKRGVQTRLLNGTPLFPTSPERRFLRGPQIPLLLVHVPPRPHQGLALPRRSFLSWCCARSAAASLISL